MNTNPLKALRDSRGMSVADLALLAGVSHSAVYDIEAGRVMGIGSQWAGAVELLGADFPATCEAYRAWRVTEQAAIAASLEPQA